MAVKTASVSFSGFDVALKFKRGVKHTRLKVAKTGEISMSLPFYATQKSAIKFLELHKKWLEKTYAKIAANLPKDDEIYLLGKIYRLNLNESFKGVNLNEDEICAPSLAAIEKFKKALASKIYKELIAKFHPYIARPINRVVIRKMRTRWGSCNSRKGYINLNLNLIEKPIELIEYVALHELAHLIYPHHKPVFYEFIASIMPDFRRRERELNGKTL